jgi:hypothetical protein
VPPPQCPECGRFLKRAVVDALTDDPTACPRCGTGLVAAMFADAADDATAPAPTGPGAEAAEERSVRPPDLGRADPATTRILEVTGGGPGSVRPPDLPPVTVRDEPRDVLEGWDVGADPAELERWRHDRPPFPTDTVIVAGAGVAGALLGALVADRRARGAVLGGLAGVVGAAVCRQVWRLEP